MSPAVVAVVGAAVSGVLALGVAMLTFVFQPFRDTLPNWVIPVLGCLGGLMIIGPGIWIGGRYLMDKRNRRRVILPTDPQTESDKADRQGGSFIIGGPGAKVRNSHIRDCYTNHPESFGGIEGSDVDSSTMERNVHESGGRGTGRPAFDLAGNSVERVVIEDCSIEYTDGSAADKRSD